MSELWPYQVLKMKISKFPKIWLGRKNCDNLVNFWDIAEIFFSYGHWWSPLKVPLIILHKICFIGPSEAGKEVRVKLTPPVLWREKYPPCGIGLKTHLFFFQFLGGGTLFSSDPGPKGGLNLKALWRSHLTSVRRPISYRIRFMARGSFFFIFFPPTNSYLL